MNDLIHKALLGIAGEYSVAAELARRNIYAQLTLGNQKRTDLLIFSEKSNKFLKVEVKCKQSKSWPNCKGINDKQSVIIFVDFKNIALGDRPDFYILTNSDWKQLVCEKERWYNVKYPNRKTEICNNILRLLNEIKSNGQVYEGCSIFTSDVERYIKKAGTKFLNY